MSSQSPSRWLVPIRAAQSAPRLHLVCFPHAGGSAMSYREWGSAAWPAELAVSALEAPARGRRFTEPALASVAQLADGAAAAIRETLPGTALAFFGHSLGAMVAFETAQRLLAAGRGGPRVLVVSGCRAPGRPPTRRETLHDLPDAQFVVRLRELNGTPPELFESAELLELLTPMLRADFRAAETYAPTDAQPLACPIVAFGGADDPEVEHADLAAWSALTSAAFRAHTLPGDHFFVQSARARVIELLLAELAAAGALAAG